MKETELGSLVIEWLAVNKPEWEIFQEIRPGKYAGSRIADLVCINKEDKVWVIELKRALNLDVIEQVSRWQVDRRSVAIGLPKRNTNKHRWWFNYMHYKMGVGSISVSALGRVREEYKAPALENPYMSEKFIEICRSGKTDGFAEAGGKGGGYWTPYKQTMIDVRKYVQNNPGCGVGDIVRDLGKMHYASEHSAKTNIVTNLKTLETSWCESKKAGYYDTFFVKEGK